MWTATSILAKTCSTCSTRLLRCILARRRQRRGDKNFLSWGEYRRPFGPSFFMPFVFYVASARPSARAFSRVMLAPRCYYETMIARHWRGWTKRHDGDAYDGLLRNKVLPDLNAIAGDRAGYVLR